MTFLNNKTHGEWSEFRTVKTYLSNGIIVPGLFLLIGKREVLLHPNFDMKQWDLYWVIGETCVKTPQKLQNREELNNWLKSNGVGNDIDKDSNIEYHSRDMWG